MSGPCARHDCYFAWRLSLGIGSVLNYRYGKGVWQESIDNYTAKFVRLSVISTSLCPNDNLRIAMLIGST
jgi:hypothetical protein